MQKVIGEFALEKTIFLFLFVIIFQITLGYDLELSFFASLALLLILLPLIVSFPNIITTYGFWTIKSMIIFGFGIIALVFFGEETFGIPYLSSDSSINFLIILSVTYLFYHVGFYNTITKRLASLIPYSHFSKEASEKNLDKYALALYAVGVIARVFKGGIGWGHLQADLGGNLYYTTFIHPLTEFSIYSFVFLVWKYKKEERRKGSLIIIILICIEVFFGLIDGSRSRAIMPFVLFIFVQIYFTRSGKNILKFSFIGLFLVIVLGGLATLFRDMYFQLLKEGGGFDVETVVTASSMVKTDNANYSLLLEQVLSRISASFDGGLRVIDAVPKVYSFAEGSTFFPGMFEVLVPRAFYPEKGYFTPGRDFAILFYNDYNVYDIHGLNVSIGIPAELYFNFDIIGCFVGGLVVGVFLQFLDQRLKTYHHLDKYTYFIRFYFVLFIVIAPDSNLLNILAGFLRMSFWLLIYLCILYRQFPVFYMVKKTKLIPL